MLYLFLLLFLPFFLIVQEKKEVSGWFRQRNLAVRYVHLRRRFEHLKFISTGSAPPKSRYLLLQNLMKKGNRPLSVSNQSAVAATLPVLLVFFS